jgi:hypothetical protein
MLEHAYSNVVLRPVEGETRDCFGVVLSELSRWGFLLESDPQLPSVTGLITRQRLRGSWWSHPLAHKIFRVNGLLEDHKDVLITKLISGKITFVHREFWPDLFAVGTARQPWQMKGLSTSARALLRLVDQKQSLSTNRLSWQHSKKPGDAARELEKKLLIHTEQLHTDTGAHAKLLETWDHWAARAKFKAPAVPPEVSKKRL